VNKLSGKVALVAGSDSGIGRAVDTAFAKEDAEAALIFLVCDAPPFFTGFTFNGGEIN